MWFQGRARMKARDDNANAVTDMTKITINCERIRRSRSIATFNVEKTRAPPSSERRTARLLAIDELAMYATARSTSRNSPIQISHGRDRKSTRLNSSHTV